ncbi:MAG TPA: hypothetical protein VN673_10995 [Clostridia bacterium]|nr:hypothetical protein [Clostridia bacterium]
MPFDISKVLRALRFSKWTTRRTRGQKARMLLYLLILLGAAAWKFVPRPWQPSITLETPHHIVFSTATRQQTEETAAALESLYRAYSNQLGSVTGFQRQHGRLKVKLHKDRDEFRWINPGLGWAEAFYQRPYCRAYYAAHELNPYHWMLHEATHQLNNEVAHLKLEKWLEEGLAEYFSTSRLKPGGLVPGQIDVNTYPVWWIDELAIEPDLAANLGNGSVIPLRSILTNRGGPAMRSHFNLYYLHWWSLTHFIFESPVYHDRALELVQKGGGMEAFEQTIGPVERVQAEWHDYVRALKTSLYSVNFQSQKLPLKDSEKDPSLRH